LCFQQREIPEWRLPAFFFSFLRVPTHLVVGADPLGQAQFSTPMQRYKTLNLEAGLPTVEEARQVLLAELRQAKQSGVLALKIIHGYGSSGKGGALRGALRKSLLRRKKEGLVTRVIFGEKWNIFEEDTRYAIENCTELRQDRDLNRSNEGITLVLFV
jgi:hypothetical protein